MSLVTRTPTRRPSVARFRASRLSSTVSYLAGRLSSASLSGLSGAGLPCVVFATDLMLPAMLPAAPDVTESQFPDVPTPDPTPVAPVEVPGYSDFDG